MNFATLGALERALGDFFDFLPGDVSAEVAAGFFRGFFVSGRRPLEAGVRDEEDDIRLHLSGQFQDSDETLRVADDFSGGTHHSGFDPFGLDPLERGGAVLVGGGNEFVVERFVVAGELDDPEPCADREFADQVGRFLLDLRERDPCRIRFVHHAGGDIEDQEDAFAGRLDPEKAHSGAATEPASARASGAEAVSEATAANEARNLVGNDLARIQRKHLVHVHFGEFRERECGGPDALHFVVEAGLRGHAVERGHVHFVLALFGREPDITRSFELGRRLGEIAGHDDRAGHEACDHVDPDADENHGDDHATDPVLLRGWGVLESGCHSSSPVAPANVTPWIPAFAQALRTSTTR